MPNKFEVGEQPCKAFKERDELGGSMGNRHECFGRAADGEYCKGQRCVCDSCGYDHHERGWENCGKIEWKDSDEF